MPQLLIVEDDKALREALLITAKKQSFDVISAIDGKHAINCIEKCAPDVILSDINMPNINGMDLLHWKNTHYPQIPMIMMTAYGDIKQAVEAIQYGAKDFIEKPFSARACMEKISQQLPLQHNDTLPWKNNDTLRLFEEAKRIANSHASVLITGESGTGKEVLSRFIHAHSSRGDKPFIAINCAAIPENMLEAILFGYQKGAFTGAIKDHKGTFEQAQQGTLLLDEISEMPLELQAKLLRVLQEKEVEPLGSQKRIALDVRIISTSNRDLLYHIEQKKFRQDLYYRLNVVPLSCIALRNRLEDLPHLLELLFQKNGASHITCNSILPETIESLNHYDWPGNIRELENMVQRVLALYENVTKITPDMFNLPLKIKPTSDLQQQLQTKEWATIQQVLKKHNGNRQKTAKQLGISERTLRYKLAKMKQVAK